MKAKRDRAVARLAHWYQHHPRKTAAVELLLCLISLAAGLRLVLYHPSPRGYIRTTGIVTAIASQPGDDNTSTGQYAMITFGTQDGQERQLNGRAHDTPIHSVGQQVAVAYYPANPNVAIDLDDRTVPAIAYVLLAIPAVILIGMAEHRFKYWWQAKDVPEDREDKALDAAEAASKETKAKA